MKCKGRQQSSDYPIMIALMRFHDISNFKLIHEFRPRHGVRASDTGVVLSTGLLTLFGILRTFGDGTVQADV